MSEKRKDNKGRLLRSGEYQDNEGRYVYKYTDAGGKRRAVYSWTLVKTDKTPSGKKYKEPLREQIKRINRDLDDGIKVYEAHKMTLNHFFDMYIETKTELKQSTLTNYKYIYMKYIRDDIGNKNITSIKYTDIKNFYLSLINERGLKPNSMEVVHTILHPVFTIAVRDGYIRMNPTDGAMKEIKKSHNWEKKKRHALTIPQQEAFVKFMKTSDTYNHWLTVMTFLLGTGCRVGEATGIRWQDCDFENNIITIDHSMLYRIQENGKCEFHISAPKTKSGIRTIPMLKPVKEALLQEKRRQLKTGFNDTIVDGYTNFIFSSRDGNVLNPASINRAIDRICKCYNAEELERARAEHREAILLPDFSAHNLRHTFCTRFCENETNLKVIMEIMGHADISTTMEIYNEVTQAKKIESFSRLEEKIMIG